ncbi:Aspartic proteinase nepenthesin-2 [Hordeum vulgare]|nr:Aspartic proteinase nepenthesin-2 [Hordeum vulgare]
MVIEALAHGGRFSYYPFVPGTSVYSYLWFGSDIPSHPPPNVPRQSTPVLAPAQNSEAYFVKLAGVSVGANRVSDATPTMFRRTEHGAGGCVVDIGTRMTSFIHAAYVHIDHAVWQHVQRRGAHIMVV